MDARRLGALTLVLLALVGAPGVALAFLYDTDPALAHDAVTVTDAAWTRALRGAHWWAASAVLALVALHLARSHAAGRLRAPGRAAALAGLAALAVLLIAFFTGTILPWDQQGWEALQHLRSGAGAVGIGVPGEAPDDAPLPAIFWVHVLAVPLVLAGALAFHLRRKLGALAALVRASWRAAALALAGVLALALLLPPALGPAPLAGLSVSRPDWPFLWLVPLQDWWGARALLALPAALALGALLLARKRAPSPASRRASLAIVAGAWLLLTVVALR